ncbi:hypothetical protein ANO11243_056480 [Dothideomycetidae sp. 11243]|nr:hypothetical protein ANO11243_056480 [fungal sp. No.11243]
MIATASKFNQAFIAPNVSRISPALLAAAAFVCIQVGLGIVFKIAQRADGTYAFSQSSSLAISEFCKLLLSTSFFYFQCKRSMKERDAADPEKQAYIALETKGEYTDGDTVVGSSSSSMDESPGSRSRAHSILKADQETAPVSEERESNQTLLATSEPFTMQVMQFARTVTQEINASTCYGMAHLALMYAVINNAIFVLFRLADPGTISLVRSGITLITALNLLVTAGQRISKRQWLAISFQICGVLVTQYHPEQGSLYPVSTYMLLIFQTTVSASAGVYNQILLKSEPGSLHVCNMSLYASGSVINIIIHVLSRIFRPEEPSFFAGYTSWGAIMVVISNIFIGLIITAVYKYADALIKCFATAVSTGILLYIAPMIFHVPLSFLVIPGSVSVFAATWLYLDSPPTAKPATTDSWKAAQMEGEAPATFMSRCKALAATFSPHGTLRAAGLAITSLSTFMIILGLLNWHTPPLIAKEEVAEVVADEPVVHFVESPFRNTLAFIRWNQELPQRIPTLMNYAPFFHDIHISMPHLNRGHREDCMIKYDQKCLFNDVTGDNFLRSEVIYTNVADTMQHILDADDSTDTSEINGLLYFHFDAWVDPMAFAHEDLTKLWILDGDNPKFECMTSIDSFKGWPPWNAKEHDFAVIAAKDVYNLVDPSLRTRLNPSEFCVGWSDIYHIPRRYFEDYIYLARLFYAQGVFHEVATPTIIHMIDLLRRSDATDTREVLRRIADCWGSCCVGNPSEHDVTWRRCGHKISLDNKKISDTFFGKLNASSELLGTLSHRANYKDIAVMPDLNETAYLPEDVPTLFLRPLEAEDIERKPGHVTYWSSEALGHGKPS